MTIMFIFSQQSYKKTRETATSRVRVLVWFSRREHVTWLCVCVRAVTCSTQRWSVCVLGSSKHYCLSFVCSCRRDTPLASFVSHRSLSTIVVLLLFCSAKIKQNRSFYLDDRTFVVCIQHHVVLLLSLNVRRWRLLLL